MSVVLAPADEPSQSVLRLEASRELGERDEEFLRVTNCLVGSCVRAAILTPEASEAYVRGLSNEVQTAVKSVSELREKNQQCFQEMSVELKLTIGDVYMKLQQVLGGIFQDNVINWGRIATVLAYGSHLAKFCTQNKLREVVESVTPWITIFISTRLKDWIIDNGGWAAYYEQCMRLSNSHTSDPAQYNSSGGWLTAIVSGISMGVGIYNRLNGR